MSLESRKSKKASKSSKCPNKLQILKEKQVGQLSLAISKNILAEVFTKKPQKGLRFLYPEA